MVWILMGFTLIALVDLIPLIKQRSGRCIAVFLVIFLVSLSLAVLKNYNVEIPNAMAFFGGIFKSLGLSYPPQ